MIESEKKTKESAPGQETLELENYLQFEEFSHEDARRTAEKIFEGYERLVAGREIKKAIGVRVVVDGLLVYQYLMDGKKEDKWLKRKENMVWEFGHSSMYIREVNDITHEYDHLKDDENLAICGGGFPITIRGEIRGTVAVSGLAHEEDHGLIVEALKILKEEGKLK